MSDKWIDVSALPPREELPHETIARLTRELEQARRERDSAVESVQLANEEMALAQADVATERMRAEKAERERDEARADVKAAAGELLIEFPAPGTDLARMLIAVGMLRTRAEAAEGKLARAREALERIGDCDGCKVECEPAGMPMVARAALEAIGRGEAT